MATGTMQMRLESELLAQLRMSELATRELTNVMRAGLAQVWTAEALEARYAAKWDAVKAMFEKHVGLELGDRRTARVHVEDVLRLDEALRR
jgi:hypothetical protein